MYVDKNIYFKFNYYSMDHRGSLDDALETKKEISFDVFRKYFRDYNYEPYCYDSRIGCYRFIIGDMQNSLKAPCWLLLEIIK